MLSFRTHKFLLIIGKSTNCIYELNAHIYKKCAPNRKLHLPKVRKDLFPTIRLLGRSVQHTLTKCGFSAKNLVTLCENFNKIPLARHYFSLLRFEPQTLFTQPRLKF